MQLKKKVKRFAGQQSTVAAFSASASAPVHDSDQPSECTSALMPDDVMLL